MAFSLWLSRKLANAGWKVKIQSRERLEDPHVTIRFKSKAWRLKLRDGVFLDGGSWSEIDEDVRQIIETEQNWIRLCDEWNNLYGDVNPV